MVSRIHLVRGFPALAALCALLPAAAIVLAQTNSTPSAAQTKSTQSGEISTQEAPLTFKSGLNLVPLPVVVRDSRGNAVGTLGVEDFQLFDNGKPQTISKFTVEKLVRDEKPLRDTAPKPAAPAPAPDKPTANGGNLVDANTDGIPDRFVAYLFDDLHMEQSDLVYTRDAAWRQIQASSDPLQRTAIYTTSSVPMQEFTTDKEKLHAALFRIGGGYANLNKIAAQHACPPMTYYMADQIINRGDTDAMKVALSDAGQCGPMPNVVTQIQRAATEALATGDRDTVAALDVMRAVVMRMAALPGQRNLVLVSPGFLVFNDRQDKQTSLIERAIRANVVISALDSRGIIGNMTIADASQHGNPDPHIVIAKYILLNTSGCFRKASEKLSPPSNWVVMSLMTSRVALFSVCSAKT